MSTMFEDPSFFTKESQGQLNNVDILAHANISEININNTYEFFKGNYVVMQVLQEGIRLETHKTTPYNHYVFIYRIISIKRFEWKNDRLFQELLNHGSVI